MCGQVGVCGNLTYAVGEIFRQMLVVDQLRGMDATGIASYSAAKDEAVVFKKAMVATDFVQLAKTKEIIGNIAYCDVMLGHNRAATRGNVVDENSHPFENEHIILAHNGTLISKGGLKTFKHAVDSQNIAANMVEMGEKETLESLYGSYSLVWINRDKRTLNFARNSERPLCYVHDEKSGIIYWASEPRMLSWILERNKLKPEKIWLPTPLRWFSLNLGDMSFSKTNFTEYTHTYKYGNNRAWESEAWEQEAEDTRRKNWTNRIPAGIHTTVNSLFNELQDAKGAATFMSVKNFSRWSGQADTGTATGTILFKDRLVDAVMYSVTEKEAPNGKYIDAKITSVRQNATTGRLEVVLEYLPPAALPLRIPGFEGRMLTREEFYRNINSGCMVCNLTAKPTDKLHWVGDKEFCHIGCKDTYDSLMSELTVEDEARKIVARLGVK